MINVAAAIIENEQGQILIARRKKGKSQEGMWEFPGGKIEDNETVEPFLKNEDIILIYNLLDKRILWIRKLELNLLTRQVIKSRKALEFILKLIP